MEEVSWRTSFVTVLQKFFTALQIVTPPLRNLRVFIIKISVFYFDRIVNVVTTSGSVVSRRSFFSLGSCKAFFFNIHIRIEVFFLFAIFITHLRESQLYAIFWTRRRHSLGSCNFRGVWATCLPHKGGNLQTLPKDTTSELAGLFSTTSPKCRAPSRELWTPFFKVFRYDSKRGLNPRYTESKAVALTSTLFFTLSLCYYRLRFQLRRYFITRIVICPYKSFFDSRLLADHFVDLVSDCPKSVKCF